MSGLFYMEVVAGDRIVWSVYREAVAGDRIVWSVYREAVAGVTTGVGLDPKQPETATQAVEGTGVMMRMIGNPPGGQVHRTRFHWILLKPGTPGEKTVFHHPTTNVTERNSMERSPMNSCATILGRL